MANFDELPYDELDPCCQKEIEINKRKSTLSQTLRRHDRSNLRKDTMKSVFRLKPGGCECCSNQTEYLFLQQLRAIEEEAAAKSVPVSADEDSDLDIDIDLDDFMTPYEQERRQEFEQHHQRLQVARARGFGSLRLDSMEHIASQLLTLSTAVVHLYNPNYMLNARIDLFLDKLAATYLGTLFRRLPWSPGVLSYLEAAVGASIHLETGAVHWSGGGGSSSSSESELGCLLCFKDGRPAACTATLQAFGDEDVLHESQLVNYLTASGVLVAGLPEEDLVYMSGLGLGTFGDEDEDDDEEAEESSGYCGDPQCGKKFPHEHVGRSNQASFIQPGDSSADEALARNEMLRV